MNIGYTAPKNAVYNRLVDVTKGRGERQWTPNKRGMAPRECRSQCLEHESQRPVACDKQ